MPVRFAHGRLVDEQEIVEAALKVMEEININEYSPFTKINMALGFPNTLQGISTGIIRDVCLLHGIAFPRYRAATKPKIRVYPQAEEPVPAPEPEPAPKKIQRKDLYSTVVIAAPCTQEGFYDR